EKAARPSAPAPSSAVDARTKRRRVFMRLLPWVGDLVYARAGGADDPRPLVELGLDVRSELLARAADADEAVVRHARLHGWRAHHLRRLRVEEVEDLARRAGGREQPVPLARLVARQSRFDQRRQIGKSGQA